MYFIGYLRRTALYALICLPISLVVFEASFKKIMEAALTPDTLIDYFCAFMFWSIVVYPAIVAIHIGLCKILDKRRSALETYFSALGMDILAPVRDVGLFLLVITRKHIIKDDSAWHNFEDLVQVVWGFIWTILMALFISFGFMNITTL